MTIKGSLQVSIAIVNAF